MTSPYRALPVVATATRTVCTWCTHYDATVPYSRMCTAYARRVPCSVVGSKIVDERRDCYTVRHEQRQAGEDECPRFEATIVTRILRAIGGRR